MGCVSCSKKKEVALKKAQRLFNATDIIVITKDDSSRLINQEDFNHDNMLLIFIPEAFTPVCSTEIGAMNNWYDEFQKLHCELILCSSDTVPKIKDWFEEEKLLNNRKFKTFSSWELPKNLKLMQINQPKPIRASVFVTPTEIVKQEHFDKVGRSFAELHRMFYGYTTGSYCAENWQNPSNGFL